MAIVVFRDPQKLVSHPQQQDIRKELFKGRRANLSEYGILDNITKKTIDQW